MLDLIYDQMGQLIVPFFIKITRKDLQSYIDHDFNFIEYYYNQFQTIHPFLFQILRNWYRGEYYTIETGTEWIKRFMGHELIPVLYQTEKSLAWFQKQLDFFNRLNDW